MLRTKLVLPENFAFATELSIRVSDLNYGGHLGNDAVLALIHEIRIRFLKKYGYSELDVGGLGIIMVDAVIVYKSQGRLGDVITAKAAAQDFDRHGFDLYYLLVNKESGREIARAKTGLLFFDYRLNKVADTPAAFRELFVHESGPSACP